MSQVSFIRVSGGVIFFRALFDFFEIFEWGGKFGTMSVYKGFWGEYFSRSL